MIERWMLGVAATCCVVGCSNKHEKCDPAKTTAIATIDQTLKELADAQEIAKRAAADSDPARLDAAHAKLDEQIKEAERELDCKRLGKESAPGLVPVQKALAELNYSPGQLPGPITTALKPVNELFQANVGLLSGPQPGIEAWCDSMREKITKLQQDLVPLWAPAQTENQAKRAEADKALAAITTREAALRAWRSAVEGTKPVSLPADNGEDVRARNAVLAYQSACH